MKIRASFTVALQLCSSALIAEDWRVCAISDKDTACERRGYSGLQQAVDRAASGDRINVGPGIYHPEVFYDVSYDEFVIRGGLLLEGKTLEIRGVSGAILDGTDGPPVSAMLIHNSDVKISGLEIRSFRLDQLEDNVYDGHGIFIINSKVTVQDVTLSHIPKMSVSIFGESQVQLTRIQVLNGHVGIWTMGTTALRVENSIFSNNDSASVVASDHTTTEVYNSVIENSQDDGIYAKENAAVSVVNSTFIGNLPYAIHAEESATISVDYSVFYTNEAQFFPEDQTDQLTIGEFVYKENPELDSDYRPGNSIYSSKGNPAVLNRNGTVSDISLYGGPSAPEG